MNITLHFSPDCGLSQNVAEERILGGQDAGHGQFPWTALIQIKGQGLDKMCAGTLVSNRYGVLYKSLGKYVTNKSGPLKRIHSWHVTLACEDGKLNAHKYELTKQTLKETRGALAILYFKYRGQN